MGKSNSYDVDKFDNNEIPTFMATKFDIGKTPEAEGGGKMPAEEVHPAGASAEKRPNWGKKVEFILACVGYAVGLGNVWRFPYLCYKSGGGAFLLPYFLMLILCGIPLMYMELAVGQYTRRGPVGALARICPLFKGAGLATVVISFLFTTYYNVIITWAMYYIGYSFLSPLPWGSCDHDWNSARCWDGSEVNGTSWENGSSAILTSDGLNFTKSMLRPNTSISPTQDFYERVVLEKTSGIEEFGDLKWDLALILLLAWVVVYFCIFKGPQSTGKVVYFTATFPYVVLLILLVRGLTLPGSLDGLIYFFKPRWELLLDAKVWVNAAAQNFNSIGIAFGGLIAMSSYNRFNNNIFRDVITVSVINSATSLLAGLVIFSILGHLAFKQQTDVKDVVSEGPGLVFIVYPEAFLSMPVAQLFAFLFFFMLICLGIDSQFASVEVVVTTIKDQFGVQIEKYVKRKEFVVAFVCIVSYICGLPNVFQGGIYFFLLIDYYAAALSLMYLAFFEVIAITWIYGGNRLARNVEEMTGSRPSRFFVICWYCVSPVLIFGIWIFSMIQYAPVKLDDYEFPEWSIGLGWGIALLSIICIPAGMIHALYTAKGDTLWQRFKSSLRSPMRDDWAASCLHDDQDLPLKEKTSLVDNNGYIVS